MRFARLSVLFFCSLMFSLSSWAMTEAEIIKSLSLPENSTGNIADAIEEATGARGVAVVIEAKHLCMMMRGVEKQNSVMTTSVMKGVFRKEISTRAEFLTLISR